jgi:hypothetical protein
MNFDASIFMSMVTAAKGMSGALQSIGMTFLSLAFCAQLTIHVYAWWLSGGADKFIGNCLHLAVVTAIPLAALLNWGAAGNMIPKFFTNEVSSSLGNGDNATAQIAKLSTIFSRISKSFEKKSESTMSEPKPVEILPGMTAEEAMQAQASAASAGSSGSGLSMAGLLGINIDLKSYLTTLVTSLILGFGCVILLFAYALAIYGNLIILYLGVAFGPIFIGLFPFKAFSYLAKSWLNFMIATGLTYAVATALIVIANSGLDIVINKITTPPPGGSSADFSTAVDVALIGLALMVFMAWLVTKADDIARSMLSGGSGGHGGGFVGLVVRQARDAARPKSPPKKG